MARSPEDTGDEVDARLGRIASLGEPVRRALYRYVAARRHPVSREQAAEAVGVPRHTAKFHLDRLESDGLLTAGYRRPDGVGGPGAGRPAKVYRPAEEELLISLPERRYRLLGEILAEAVATASASGADLPTAVRHAAASAGHDAGTAAAALGDASGDPLHDAADLLAACGYDPQRENGAVVLANCPFHALAAQHTELVCGLNAHFVEAALEASGRTGVRARLAPSPGHCCVRVEPTSR
ncbi:MAG: helix-turn-helix transcriptional regulator [Marmoricola sp.]